MVLIAPKPRPPLRPAGDRRGRPVLFVVLAYALSWAWLIPLAAAGATVVAGHGWPTHVPALLGPLLAAVACAALAGRRSLRALGAATVRWRIGWRWWAVAVSPVLVLLATAAVLAATGMPLAAGTALGHFSGLPAGWGVLGVAAVLVLIGGLGEETGWRGYLQPALQARLSPVAATGVVAVMWMIWHIPAFFLIQNYRDFLPQMLPMFVIGLAGGAVVLAWLYNSTRSVLACAVWHGLFNLTSATATASTAATVIQAVIWTAVVVMAVVLLILEWRARRRGRASVLNPHGSGVAPSGWLRSTSGGRSGLSG